MEVNGNAVKVVDFAIEKLEVVFASFPTESTAVTVGLLTSPTNLLVVKSADVELTVLGLNVGALVRFEVVAMRTDAGAVVKKANETLADVESSILPIPNPV